MIFRNKYLFILFTLICLAGLVKQWVEHNKSVDNYDLSKELSGQREVVEARRVSRNGDCANWVRVLPNSDSAAENMQNYFYIESADGSDLPPAYTALADSGYVLKLEGYYYKGVGIPAHHIQASNLKPEKARIFKYTRLQVVKPE